MKTAQPSLKPITVVFAIVMAANCQFLDLKVSILPHEDTKKQVVEIEYSYREKASTPRIVKYYQITLEVTFNAESQVNDKFQFQRNILSFTSEGKLKLDNEAFEITESELNKSTTSTTEKLLNKWLRKIINSVDENKKNPDLELSLENRNDKIVIFAFPTVETNQEKTKVVIDLNYVTMENNSDYFGLSISAGLNDKNKKEKVAQIVFASAKSCTQDQKVKIVDFPLMKDPNGLRILLPSSSSSNSEIPEIKLLEAEKDGEFLNPIQANNWPAFYQYNESSSAVKLPNQLQIKNRSENGGSMAKKNVFDDSVFSPGSFDSHSQLEFYVIFGKLTGPSDKAPCLANPTITEPTNGSDVDLLVTLTSGTIYQLLF